jgi:hypothetical protein
VDRGFVRRDGFAVFESPAQFARWRTTHDCVWRDVSCYNRTGRYDCASPDGDPGQQYRPEPDPYVVFDYDFLAYRCAGTNQASDGRSVAYRVAHGPKIVITPTDDGDSVGEQAKAADPTIRFDVNVFAYVHMIGKHYVLRSPQSTARTNVHIVSDGQVGRLAANRQVRSDAPGSGSKRLEHIPLPR